MPTQVSSQNLDRGRIGTQASISRVPFLWSGTLVDAGCRDRTSVIVPWVTGGEIASQVKPVPVWPKPAATGAAGISVPPAVKNAERSREVQADTMDHATRYADPNCAITGETKGFALVLPDGRWLNLDEGGNTLAFEALQSTTAGRAIVNGSAKGEKPPAKVKGILWGDTIKVQALRLS